MQNQLCFADLALILALCRGGTLAGAAERLKVDVSTVFRSIKRLEKELGEVLFDRGREGYMPTDMARELAAYAERIEGQLEEAREVAFKTSAEPSGKLRITTVDSVLHCLLLPVMARFAAAYPKIDFELAASNSLANLSQREADIAIRATRKPPEHLIGVRLGTFQAALFGGKEYLASLPPGTRVEDMEWIALDENLPDHPSHKWRRQRYPKAKPRYLVDSMLPLAGAVIHGLGVGVAPVYMLKDHPSVEMMEGPSDELGFELWALAHPGTRHLQRVRAVMDFLKQNLVLP